MLVLTRRVDEEILLADGIRIRVVAIKGRRVRLGIAAPASVRVVRQELLDAPEQPTRPRSTTPPVAAGREAPVEEPCTTPS